MTDTIKINMVLLVVFSALGMMSIIGACVGATHQLFVAGICLIMAYASYVDGHYGMSVKKYLKQSFKNKRIKPLSR